MITSTKGLMDESTCEKRTGSEINADSVIHWVEYWLENECIHRSVEINLTGVEMKLEQGLING